MRIGIDFDNTIIRYDGVFLTTALERDLLPPGFQGTKKEIRDAIRLLPDGELSWQKLQGHVYGRAIGGAEIASGLDLFLRRARAAGCTILIVSHKTEFGHFDPERVNLREAALAWMSAAGFFDSDGFGIQRSNVHFEATRAEKLARIGAVRCDVFIDDLEEVLDDPAFPAGIERVLFSDQTRDCGKPYSVCPDWESVGQVVFRDAADPALAEVRSVAQTLVSGRVLRLDRLSGGRNSRVYRAETSAGTFALKRYPSALDDPRDRLGAEVAALRWMERHGIASVPGVVATDPVRNFALLTWADGTLVGEIGDAELDQAVAFLAELHRLCRVADFPAGRLAAEACLSGAEVERQLRARLDRLHRVSTDPALSDFLETQFEPSLALHLNRARAQLKAARLSFAEELPAAKRSLVPSDFGFHNALRRADGRLTFIDFEYFGWDDPVKLTADMLLHPGIPLNEAQQHRFRRAAEWIYGDDPTFAGRLAALEPLFCLRWALIVLNEFDPERWRQRVLAGAIGSWDEAKQRQLGIARAMLARLRIEEMT